MRTRKIRIFACLWELDLSGALTSNVDTCRARRIPPETSVRVTAAGPRRGLIRYSGQSERRAPERARSGARRIHTSLDSHKAVPRLDDGIEHRLYVRWRAADDAAAPPSAVAVCCSSASGKSRYARFLNSRAFSMAIAAWSAKV